MEQGEILDQLKKIVTEHDMHHSISPPPPLANTCWFDGDKCPYGFPNGRFQDRPVQICFVGGCKKLAVIEEIADDFLRNETRLNELVEKNQVSLSSELRVIAEDLDKGPKRKVLELAANIIAGKLDKEIVRVNDI